MGIRPGIADGFPGLERRADGTALLEAKLGTGRTNQIRIHLWHMGHLVGDPAYLPGRLLGDTQTLMSFTTAVTGNSPSNIHGPENDAFRNRAAGWRDSNILVRILATAAQQSDLQNR
jgi:hypothetical protein